MHVCDRPRGVYKIPRAIALDHEVMCVFQQLGVAEVVAPYTEPFTPSQWFGADGPLIRRMTMVAPPYPQGYTPSLVFSQPPVDALLRDRVAQLPNVTMALGTELEVLTQDADGVTLQLQADDGSASTVQARWVIGCDGGDWLRNARNVQITGATGSGKTWLACALAHQAARGGFSVLYVRAAARLFDDWQVAHGNGNFVRRLAQMAKLDLLVDDFAISAMGLAERCDLLDDCIGTRSTLITSQLPVKAWHTDLGDPTLTDAILDRVVNSSQKIELKGTRSGPDSDGATAQ